MVNLTIEDCLKMYENGVTVVISNGNVVGVETEIPAPTANQCGD